MRQIEPYQSRRAFDRHGLPDVSVHMVSQLMGQHDFNLIVRVVGQERVRHKNSSGAEESNERRVGMSGLLGEAPLVDAEHGGTSAVHQGLQTNPERSPFDRRAPIHQRKQQDRAQMVQADDREREDESRDNPPAVRPELQGRIHEDRSRHGDHQRHPNGLDILAEPSECVLGRAAVATVQHHASVDTERQRHQSEQRTQHHDIAGHDDGERPWNPERRSQSERDVAEGRRTRGE